MTPRLRICSSCLAQLSRLPSPSAQLVRTMSQQAITPAPGEHPDEISQLVARHAFSQPPSLKPPEFRRTQLHRQYTSMLKSTPLIVLFQHNNLTASEWASIRRELHRALDKTDKHISMTAEFEPLADHIKIQVIKTGIFGAALRVVEYFGQDGLTLQESSHSISLDSQMAQNLVDGQSSPMHALSREAHHVVLHKRYSHPLSSLLSGPVAVLTFPVVSTEHLKTAISILTPSKPDFPAPTRKLNPSYYESAVQTGLPKLMLLGARVEGSVFDVGRTKWVGTIAGGLDGLRAQLVTTLQGAGAAVTSSLESATRSIYYTLEGRKNDLEK